MKKTLLVLAVLFCGQISAQQVLNQYKYVILPSQFTFQKTADEYQINSLTKFLLKKKHFNVLYGDVIYGDELKTNPCLALRINEIRVSSFLKTKIIIEFKDCQNRVVFSTIEGYSRLKDYKKGYFEAIRMAFTSLDGFDYKYAPEAQKTTELKIIETPITIEKPTLSNKKAITKEIVKNKKPVLDKPILTTDKIETIKSKKQQTIKASVKSIVGLYKYNNEIYEITAFKDYFLFLKRKKKANYFVSQSLGFIYKALDSNHYLIKTNHNKSGVLLKNGNFEVKFKLPNGDLKSVIYQKTAY